MPSDPSALLILLGAAFILIGLLGGGVEIAAIRVPAIGRVPRALTFTLGAGLLVVGLNSFLGRDRRRPPPPPDSTTTTTTTPPPPYMGPLEGGINRQGGDLSSTGIQVNTAEECSDMCLHNGNCRAMTFVKNPNANGGFCWLKGSIPPQTPNDYMVSAVKNLQ